jgi:hypothetical protein
MPPLIDLTNKKFERLVVICRYFDNSRRTKWVCKCDCGETIITRGDALVEGRTKSCNCLHKEKVTKHGLYKHPIYRMRRNIISRCYEKRTHNYKNYGGKGIIMCQSWLDDPWNFFIWAIKKGWRSGLFIDRINVNGNYEPSNCTFVNILESAANKDKYSKYGTGIEKTRQGKYTARITYNVQRYYLGTFNDLRDASKAYNQAKNKFIIKYNIPVLDINYGLKS